MTPTEMTKEYHNVLKEAAMKNNFPAPLRMLAGIQECNWKQHQYRKNVLAQMWLWGNKDRIMEKILPVQPLNQKKAAEVNVIDEVAKDS